MKTSFVALFAVMLVFLGCADSPKVDVHFAEKAAEVEKTVAKIGVEGMMCEIACGGKIRKELSELDGVASASIEFQEGENVNFAMVEYNPERVSEVELMNCINGISDGKLYSVSNMEVTHYAPSASVGTSAVSDDINMTRGFELPGISDILRSFIRGIGA
jgi:Cu+-exporting ATPase